MVIFLLVGVGKVWVWFWITRRCWSQLIHMILELPAIFIYLVDLRRFPYRNFVWARPYRRERVGRVVLPYHDLVPSTEGNRRLFVGVGVGFGLKVKLSSPDYPSPLGCRLICVLLSFACVLWYFPLTWFGNFIAQKRFGWGLASSPIASGPKGS